MLKRGLGLVVFSRMPLCNLTFTEWISSRSEFISAGYLRVPKTTIEKALEITNHHANFFLYPYDAVVLHGEITMGLEIYSYSRIVARSVGLTCAPDNYVRYIVRGTGIN
ncbi:MAG: hypothetical protein GX409_07535 [candidate division Zixibacteria bacterium]|nr:hypothetical protein [candidate division Zixibacteria bacterium]